MNSWKRQPRWKWENGCCYEYRPKFDRGDLSTSIRKGVVTPANYNTPAQIVIGGEVAAVDYAVELLQEAGAKRLIPLNVSGPFHTALLESASQNWRLN